VGLVDFVLPNTVHAHDIRLALLWHDHDVGYDPLVICSAEAPEYRRDALYPARDQGRHLGTGTTVQVSPNVGCVGRNAEDDKHLCGGGRI
jgi:hypothetical protein